MKFDLFECQIAEYQDINYLGDLESNQSLKILSFDYGVIISKLLLQYYFIN